MQAQPAQLNRIERFFLQVANHGTSFCIFIVGRRETGKTDISLFAAEIYFLYGVIKNIATNIKIYESPFPIEHCTNLEDLEFWCQTVPGKKLFILDEAGKSFRRRTPMSKLNIELIDKLQILRKYHLSIIFIAPHEKYVDSAGLGSDVLDAMIIKPQFKNPKVGIFADILEQTEIELKEIPATQIKFDTWDIAPFKLKAEVQKPQFQDRELDLLWKWCEGQSFKDLGLHPMQLNRLCKKFIKKTLESQVHTSHQDAIEDSSARSISQNRIESP